SRYLSDRELILKYGWAGDSSMPGTYAHLSGADLDDKLLAIYSGRPVETIKPKFSPIICPRCGYQNTPGTRFCSRCGTPLTQEDLSRASVEYESLKSEIEEIRRILRDAFRGRRGAP
ncbi:MAG: zinc ribbon domain-containing protein, partial [Nitrososphaeria archaeon]